jgi:hypothetical protein
MKDNKSTFHRTSLSRSRSHPAELPNPAERKRAETIGCTQSTASRCSVLILLLLGVLVSTSCTLEVVNLPATQTASAMQTASVTPTVTRLPSIEVALKSFHGQYVTAMGEDDGWLLKQEVNLSPCGWFTLHYLDCGKVALETCHGRYVVAPTHGTSRWDWMLGQESQRSDCGQFDLYELGNDKVAFKTCAGKFFTAGDNGWEPPWSVGAATEVLLDWEIFTVVRE